MSASATEESFKHLIVGGVCLGHECTRCDGEKGYYLTETKPDGTKDFVYGGWQNQDPQWKKCEVCIGKGVIDSEEGAVLRQWLGK